MLADSNYAMITLVTCEGFNESSEDYIYRRAVQAVLVSVDTFRHSFSEQTQA